MSCQLLQAYVERLGLDTVLQEKFADASTNSLDNNSHQNNDIPNSSSPANRILTFEKTPNYMIWPHVPAAIVEVCPWRPKIILVLRNPVDRLYSQYQMQFVQEAGVPSLSDVLAHELSFLHKFGLSHAPLPPNVTTMTTATNQTTTPLLNHNEYTFMPPPHFTNQERDKIESIHFRGFGNHGSFHRYLQRGMYVYQVQRFLQHFERPSQLLVIQYERLRHDMAAVWDDILAFVGAAPYALSPAALHATYRPSLDTDNRKEMPPAAPLDASVRQYLIDFYKPYNALLADVLGEEWRGIWDV